MSKLSDDEFLDIIKKTPLVAIDLVIQNKNGHVFIGKRVNDPAKDFWFVPGGRIRKNELFYHALIRLMKEELGLEHFNGSYTTLGIYDHMYDTCFYKPDPKTTSTHYVVIGVKLQVNDNDIDCSKILDQHSCYRWVDIQSLLIDQNIHQNTKNYFININNHQIIY
jgi:colanic acid biosynthesis protein WcaH